MSKTIRESGGVRSEEMEQDFDADALAGADDNPDSLRDLRGNVQEYRSIADRLQSNMRPDNDDPFKDLEAPMEDEGGVFSSLDAVKEDDDGWNTPEPTPYADDGLGQGDEDDMPAAPRAAPLPDVTNGWGDDAEDLADPLAGTPFAEPAPASSAAGASMDAGMAGWGDDDTPVPAPAAPAAPRREEVMPSDWSVADEDPDEMISGLVPDEEKPVRQADPAAVVAAPVDPVPAASPAAAGPRRMLGIIPLGGLSFGRKKVVVSDETDPDAPVREMVIEGIDSDGDSVADTPAVVKDVKKAPGGRKVLLWTLPVLALAGSLLAYTAFMGPGVPPAQPAPAVQPLPAEDGATIPLPPEAPSATPADGAAAVLPASPGVAGGDGAMAVPAEGEAVATDGGTVTTLTVPVETVETPGAAPEAGGMTDGPDLPAADLAPAPETPAASTASIDDLFGDTASREGVDSEEVAVLRRSIDEMTLRMEAQNKQLKDALASFAALEESIRLRDSAMDVQDRKIAEAVESSTKARDLAMQQNEVLIQFARVEETVNQMGTLLGQVTARLSQTESGVGGMEQRIGELGTQFRQLRRDLGAVMRTTLDPADLAPPVVEAPALALPAGAGAVYQSSGEPLRLPAESAASVPPDVKVGDEVPGTGKVLAIDPMADGRRLVIMENGRQAIID